mgnify:CR=1 FL=1
MALSTFRNFMTSPSLYGPQSLGTFVPQGGEGLGLPGGGVSFNLPRTAPAPGTSVNMPGGMVGGQGGAPSLKMSITRTASSDPVQNIINDIINPLNSTNVDLSPPDAQAQKPQSGMSSLPGAPPINPFTPIGARGDSPFPIGVPNFQQWGQQQQPGFGLRTRMTNAAMRSPQMPQFAFL